MTRRDLIRSGAAALAASAAGGVAPWLSLSSSVSAQTRRPGSLKWVWSGAVTPTSATVKARLALPSGGARLLLIDEGDTRPEARAVPAGGLSAHDADGLIEFSLTNLRPDTRYRYTVETAEGRSLAGRFHTFGDGPFSFRVAFASCASTGSNSPVFDAIRGLSPDLFIHMGDFHYRNISRNSPRRFRQAYDDVLASPRQSAMYRAMPLAYVWDDHDFGPNDADGTSPSKPAAFSTYQQMVPHYRLGTPGNQSVNHAFTIGRVRFIVTDTRSSRAPRTLADASRRTMLGQVQLEWFERELEAAIGHALVVWVNTVPWITRRKGQTDGWERYSLERTRIADRIASLGLTRRMVMLSGDAHMVAIDDGTNSNYRTGAAPDQPGFPVVQAAPMDRLTSEKGGPYSNGISRKRGQFGLMEVTDDGSRLRVELSGRDIRGLVIPRMRIVMECLDGQPCRVIENDAVRRRP